MTDETYETKYLKFLGKTIGDTRRMADRAMFQYVILRIALIVCSASLPAVISTSSTAVTPFGLLPWSTVLAVTVAILTGFDTQFQWGEEWRHFRSAQMTLERYMRLYESRGFALESGLTTGNVKTPAENFGKLNDDVETFLRSNNESFFRFRITEWKSPQGQA